MVTVTPHPLVEYMTAAERSLTLMQGYLSCVTTELGLDTEKLSGEELEAVLGFFQGEGGALTYRVSRTHNRNGRTVEATRVYRLQRGRWYMHVGSESLFDPRRGPRRQRGDWFAHAVSSLVGRALDDHAAKKRAAMVERGRTTFYADGSLLVQVKALFGDGTERE